VGGRAQRPAGPDGLAGGDAGDRPQGTPGARTASAALRAPAAQPAPHGFAQNQIWCELVAMARELAARMQMLAIDGPARAWEP